MSELREALESAITQSETEAETPAEAPVAQTEPSAEASASSIEESSSVEETEAAPAEVSNSEPAKATEPKKDGTPETTQETSGKPQHRVDRPPQSWKKEAKGEWNNLPLHVRQEVYRREAQVNQVLHEAAQHRQIAEQFSQVIAPYQARINSLGAAPAELVGRLLQTEYALATGTRQQTAQMIAKLVKDYDVDIEALDAALSGTVAQRRAAPAVNDIQSLVQQQVQQALAPVYQQQQAAIMAEKQKAVETVESMALNPDYPFFDEVRDEMADLIDLKAQKGIYLSLEEAYDMAVKINPNTANRIQRQNTMQTATQAHQQAQRAKTAASSVSGAPASVGAMTMTGDGSLRGAIEAAFGGQRI